MTIVQADLVWEDKAANLAHFDSLLNQIEGSTDLIVLPEMFTTGFSMNSANLADDMTSEAVLWLHQKSKDYNAAIMGSIIAKEDDSYYNRLICALPDGTSQTYDKKHLFTLAGEHDHYQSGKERIIVKYKGWNICPLICYDLRFPEWARNRGEYDLLIYIASWPEPRAIQWRSLLQARAIENQSYTIGVNRVGEDGNGLKYKGNSSIINYSGEVLVDKVNEESVHTEHLNLESLRFFRKKLPFLEDQDRFSAS